MASFRQLQERLTCRQVLTIMVIFGFMLNYMLRVNLTIAIVAMVIPRNSLSQNMSNVSQECFEPSSMINYTNSNSTSNDSNYISTLDLPDELPQTRYDWNEYEVNFILGAFFWGYLCTELPGGRLAEVIGAKRVLGYSMLCSSIITLLTPIAASLGYQFIALLRITLGLMLGATWPALYPLASLWVPPTDRSKFISNTMASSLGAAVMMQIGGFLIASYGWESVFYFTGIISCFWCVVWFIVIYDSPSQHPRISSEERRYIEESLGNTSTKKALPVPWKSILTSIPVWAIIITGGCNAFGFFCVVNQLPTYMKYILNYKIEENGLLSSLPYIGKYILSLFAASFADYLHRTNKLSVTAIRKIFNTIADLAPGIGMICLSLFGCDRAISVTIFTIALTLNGTITAGYLGNSLDIAPNFSGTIYGIANTLNSIAGYLGSFMVGSLTYNNQTFRQWRIIFWILAGMYITGALSFLIGGTGKLQEWNNPSDEKSKNKIELTDIQKQEEESISFLDGKNDDVK
ncbi:sialin-like [Chelonus insularis]|uniref:sialin-like n=1 Tax=Chelonus insularis TaxID=460826 RepID=UPI0015885E17|nr:sialin-like [Chelonus insularis]